MPLESCVDVLIIGAGPAGLMCANALAMAGVGVRIIDKRPMKITTGRADGIHPGTIEVFQSYGLAERMIREGNQIHMHAFYGPGPDGGIQSIGRTPCIGPLTNPRYPFVIGLNQGAIEAILLDSMKKHGLQVERPRQPVGIEISDDVDELSSLSSYPVKVTIERLDAIDEGSKTEIVYAKFVVGADGAHSWTRSALGIDMKGDQTDHVWGVVDVVPETNFPDIRNITTILSVEGSCRIIPREGDLVRLYIQLLNTDIVDPLAGRVDKSRVTPQKLLSACRKMLHPFKLADPKEIDWWTVYLIGQRLASSYSVKDRVFIAGDACHTHSPKAGQGMNASMGDTHNLAWKLAQVLRGWSEPSLLKTYERERREFAQDLIDTDKKYVNLMSERSRTVENEGDIFREELELLQAPKKIAEFLSGTGVHYSPSAIVDPKHQRCAENLIIGQRVHPQIFVRAADMRPVEIQDLLLSDVRFKVLFFVGYLTETRVSELMLLAKELSKPSSFLQKYTPDGNMLTVFDIIIITSGQKEDMNYFLVPEFFRPHWTKVLLDDTDATESKGGRGYESFGIDPEQITLVVVRPDGYVGSIAPSSAVADLDDYFGSFMLPGGLASTKTAYLRARY